jgi:predicted DNA-binding ribbon-helix-helix protein
MWGQVMQSCVPKRSVVIAGRKTSISLEDEFWKSLREIADARRETLTQLINAIDADRKHANLSSAARLFVLGFYRDQVVDQIAEGSALETLGTPERRVVT